MKMRPSSFIATVQRKVAVLDMYLGLRTADDIHGAASHPLL